MSGDTRSISWFVCAVFAVPAVGFAVAATLRPADNQRNWLVIGVLVTASVSALAAPPIRAALGKWKRAVAAEWRPQR